MAVHPVELACSPVFLASHNPTFRPKALPPGVCAQYSLHIDLDFVTVRLSGLLPLSWWGGGDQQKKTHKVQALLKMVIKIVLKSWEKET